MGGEDMAYYLQLVPGTYFFLGGTNKEKNITPVFSVDFTLIIRGAKVVTEDEILCKRG